MRRTWLVLTLALWPTLASAFTIARVDTFQQRNYRNSLGEHDYTFAGFDDATLFAAAGFDSTNYGGWDSLCIGLSTASRSTARIWIRINFGSKLPSGYALDSAKMVLTDVVGTGADTTGVYVVKKNGIIEGTGTGPTATPSGICWRRWLQDAAEGGVDLAWINAGAEAADSTQTSVMAFNTRQRFRLLTTLTADTTKDRGRYPDAIAKYSAHGGPTPYTWDITDIVEGWIQGWIPNNGVLMKDNTEAASRCFFVSSEIADSTTAPMIVLWGKDTSASNASHLGTGQYGVWK